MLTILGLDRFFGFVSITLGLILFFIIMCVCIAWKSRPRNDLYTVSGGMLNPTHSLTHSLCKALGLWCGIAITRFIRSVKLLYAGHG